MFFMIPLQCYILPIIQLFDRVTVVIKILNPFIVCSYPSRKFVLYFAVVIQIFMIILLRVLIFRLVAFVDWSPVVNSMRNLFFFGSNPSHFLF